MPQCAFKNCKNNHRNTNVSDGISYFRFPGDKSQREKWISIVAEERQESSYRPRSNSVICSIHFDKNDIIGNPQRHRLNKSALPKFQGRVKGEPNENEYEVPVSYDFYNTASDYKSESDDSDSEQASQQYQVDVQGSWRAPAASPDQRSASPASPPANPPASPPVSPPAASSVASPPARRRKRARTTRQYNADTNEFYVFGECIAAQLNSMPLGDAIELQLEIQQLISRKRLSKLQRDAATQSEAPDPLYLLVKAEPTEGTGNA